MTILFEQINEDDKYKNGIRVEDYKGNISIMVIQEGKDGKAWPKWCYPQKRVEGKNVASDKSIPMSVSLGNRADAVYLLTEMLAALGEESLPPVHTKQPFNEFDPGKGDIPF